MLSSRNSKQCLAPFVFTSVSAFSVIHLKSNLKNNYGPANTPDFNSLIVQSLLVVITHNIKIVNWKLKD